MLNYAPYRICDLAFHTSDQPRCRPARVTGTDSVKGRIFFDVTELEATPATLTFSGGLLGDLEYLVTLAPHASLVDCTCDRHNDLEQSVAERFCAHVVAALVAYEARFQPVYPDDLKTPAYYEWVARSTGKDATSAETEVEKVLATPPKERTAILRPAAESMKFLRFWRYRYTATPWAASDDGGKLDRPKPKPAPYRVIE